MRVAAANSAGSPDTASVRQSSTLNPESVLVLQDNRAYWFRVAAGRIVDSVAEDISDNAEALAVCPPWMDITADARPQDVSLVLDTSLDEVDRISVEKTGLWLVDRYRQWTTLARLRRDYPHANVYSLSAFSKRYDAAVMHPVYPSSWNPWLLKCQSLGIVFHQTCSATEVVARWSRCFEHPVFVIMQAGSYQRHLLVHEGATMFLRSVTLGCPESGEPAAVDLLTERAVEQSMEYLQAADEFDLDDIRVMNLSALNSRHPGDRAAVRESASDVNEVDAVQNDQSAIPAVLLSMLLGNTLAYRSHDLHHGQASDEWMKPGRLITKNSSRFQTMADTVRRLIVKDGRSGVNGQSLTAWPLAQSTLRWADALAPSVRQAKTRRRRTLAYRWVAMLAIVSVLVFCIVLFNAFESSRALNRQQLHIETLVTSLADVQTQALKMHASPANAADSLLIRDQLASLSGVTARQVLDDIAASLVPLPDIVLDQIAWSVVENDAAFDTFFNALDAVDRRQSFVDDDAGSVMHLELSGRAVGHSLAEQKRQLDNFVTELQRTTQSNDITVLESPADAALSSEWNTVDKDSFRLSIVRGRSQ